MGPVGGKLRSVRVGALRGAKRRLEVAWEETGPVADGTTPAARLPAQTHQDCNTRSVSWARRLGGDGWR